MGSRFERGERSIEALEKNKRVGAMRPRRVAWRMKYARTRPLPSNYCIIVYCGGATQSWRRNNRRTSVYV